MKKNNNFKHLIQQTVGLLGLPCFFKQLKPAND
jgi:hypothetical protein